MAKSNIRRHIEAILANRAGVRLSATRKLLVTLAALGAVHAPLSVGAVATQLAEEFDVASIRAVEAPRNYIRMQVVGDTFVAEGVTAAVLIRYAYDLKDFQLSGGPDWIWERDMQFDVRAKFTGESRMNRVRPMIQRLLVDRFQLQVRRDQRTATIYELVVAKGDATLIPAKTDTPARRGCFPYPATCTDVSMDDFADYLSSVVVSQVVVNKTGLSGRYDLKVSWAADNSQFRGNGGSGFFSGDGPSLFTALTEQAGLQLRAVKGEIPVVVVERVSPPSEN